MDRRIIDEDDILKRIETKTSKEKTARGLICMLEYFICILRFDLKE